MPPALVLSTEIPPMRLMLRPTCYLTIFASSTKMEKYSLVQWSTLSSVLRVAASEAPGASAVLDALRSTCGSHGDGRDSKARSSFESIVKDCGAFKRTSINDRPR